HAAAGGVGTAACQLGAAAGAKVIGVVGGPAKAEVAKDSGADEVLMRGDDWGGWIKKAHRGVDVAFDPVGGAAVEGAGRGRALDGRRGAVGFAGRDPPPVRPD